MSDLIDELTVGQNEIFYRELVEGFRNVMTKRFTGSSVHYTIIVRGSLFPELEGKLPLELRQHEDTKLNDLWFNFDDSGGAVHAFTHESAMQMISTNAEAYRYDEFHIQGDHVKFPDPAGLRPSKPSADGDETLECLHSYPVYDEHVATPFYNGHFIDVNGPHVDSDNTPLLNLQTLVEKVKSEATCWNFYDIKKLLMMERKAGQRGQLINLSERHLYTFNNICKGDPDFSTRVVAGHLKESDRAKVHRSLSAVMASSSQPNNAASSSSLALSRPTPLKEAEQQDQRPNKINTGTSPRPPIPPAPAQNASSSKMKLTSQKASSQKPASGTTPSSASAKAAKKASSPSSSTKKKDSSPKDRTAKGSTGKKNKNSQNKTSSTTMDK